MTNLTEQVARVMFYEHGSDIEWDPENEMECRWYISVASTAIKAMEQHHKPSWDSAPEWAQWLAMDEDGVWMWYDEKPEPIKPSEDVCGHWADHKYGSFMEARRDRRSQWQSTLEPRPDPDKCEECDGYGAFPFSAGDGDVDFDLCMTCEGSGKLPRPEGE